MNRMDRVGMGDKDLNRLMDQLNEDGYTVVAVHCVGMKFYVFSVMNKVSL